MHRALRRRQDHFIGRQPLETFDEKDWELIYRTGVLGTLWP